MVKVGHFTGSIMAIHTIGAKQGCVVGDECGSGCRVALSASRVRMFELLAAVAAATDETGAVIIRHVLDQVKPGGGRMLERLAVHHSWQPAAGRVAVGAVGAEHT